MNKLTVLERPKPAFFDDDSLNWSELIKILDWSYQFGRLVRDKVRDTLVHVPYYWATTTLPLAS